MIPEHVQKILNTPRGQFVTIITKRKGNLRVAYQKNIVEKLSTFQVQIGVDYASKVDHTPGPLPWGEWVQFPYLIQHNEKLYIRCTKFRGAKVIAQWYLNGKPVEKEEIAHMLLASENRERTGPDENVVFTICVNDIVNPNNKEMET